MRAFVIVAIQLVLAVLVSGLIMPAILLTVPQSRDAGPVTILLLAGVLFALLRVAWPPRHNP